MEAFFIIGCIRSGTTALTRIFQTAGNAIVHSEMEPKLCIEAGHLVRKKLASPIGVLKATRGAPINTVASSRKKFGDKNANYMPFVQHLIELWDCKIVLAVRDGRDVVRSMMDWHSCFAGNIFTRQEDDPASGKTKPEEDPWDYSRLRPHPDTETGREWVRMTRFEKCAWHWAAYNKMALELLEQAPRDKWCSINMTGLNTDDVEELYKFLELDGFDRKKVKNTLTARVNSIADRVGLPDQFPPWSDWSVHLRRQFDDIAGEMMHRLNYY